jgi:stress-induced morphogen
MSDRLSRKNAGALPRKIRTVLREAFPPDVKVVVSDGGDEDFHLKVVSSAFSGKRNHFRGEMIWSVLFEKLAPDEWGTISLTEGLTPREANGSPLG